MKNENIILLLWGKKTTEYRDAHAGDTSYRPYKMLYIAMPHKRLLYYDRSSVVSYDS